MSDLPVPPVPPEVDLRGMEWMPYYGDRLGRSAFNSVCSDAAWRSGHNLWWAAWNNVPAASLPNDEAQLARYADLGRDVKAFRKIKDDALHGFILCSDGRLYHPFLAELALQAWDKRLKERERKARWRAGASMKETEWGALRAAVLERDKHKCRNCGSTSNLNCDHIVPVSKGGLTIIDNMQTLCAACNKRKRDRNIMVPDENEAAERGHSHIQERGQNAAAHVAGTRERRGEDRTGDKKERSADADPKKAGDDADDAYAWPMVEIDGRTLPAEVPMEWVGEMYQSHPLVDGYAASAAFGAYWTEGKGAGKTRSERGWRQCWRGWIGREKPGRTAEWINRYGYDRYLHGALAEPKAAAC